jgi:hypothetical protein
MDSPEGRPTVYVETTVISYLCSKPSRDVVVAGHQQTTADWWNGRGRFTLRASQLVVDEAAAGDEQAAGRRLEALSTIDLLELTEEAVSFADALVSGGVIPATSAADALHIGIAVVAGCDFLVTWNYRHMANAALRLGIEACCRSHGYDPVVICTPEELTEVE